MTQLRIGIDFDDVLVNSADYTARLYNEEYGTALTRDNWYDFSLPDAWKATGKLEIVARIQAIMHADTFTGLEQLTGAQQTLGRLKKLGHKLFVITGRPQTMASPTARTAAALYPGIFDTEDIYLTDYFGHGALPRPKAEVAQTLELTHFIDDQVDHANAMAAVGIKALLFSDGYVWNQKGADASVEMVSSWQEIGEYFDGQSQSTAVSR